MSFQTTLIDFEISCKYPEIDIPVMMCFILLWNPIFSVSCLFICKSESKILSKNDLSLKPLFGFWDKCLVWNSTTWYFSRKCTRDPYDFYKKSLYFFYFYFLSDEVDFSIKYELGRTFWCIIWLGHVKTKLTQVVRSWPKSTSWFSPTNCTIISCFVLGAFCEVRVLLWICPVEAQWCYYR